MLNYELDKLGWYEFELMIQALLKAQLGLGVEAWGGRGDFGRDASFVGEMPYPTKVNKNGVFIFQCKFVEKANAAGAKPESNLIRAVKAECLKLEDEIQEPTVYTLLSNAVISAGTRTKITNLFRTFWETAEVYIQDGKDISAMLMNSPNIVRSFPQLLGLANLTELLANQVNSDILQRSEAALAEAQKIREVFIPTKAYSETLSKLNSHYFVVLEGLPEMGKTALGRMISLTKLSEEWMAVECRRPEDFFRVFNKDTKQIFLADDFLGRTEYETSRVSSWESELPGIFRLLDDTHWLIFTSRAHLLKIAENTIDVSGSNHQFPRLNEVIIDAGQLSTEEKARILYRHAKAADLSDEAKHIIKTQASKIINNPYYTPERIRRLVQEWLPKKVDPNIKQLYAKDIEVLIRRNLQDPTQGMRKTFHKLSPAHKWLLFSFIELEYDTGYETERAKQIYENICPISERKSFQETLDQVSEGFLVSSKTSNGKAIHNWAHPSVVDLIIDEWRREENLTYHYLRNCSAAGIELVTAAGGGSHGEVDAPLLINKKAWKILTNRIKELIEVSNSAFILSVLLKNYQAIQANSKLNKHDELMSEFAKLLFTEITPLVVEKDLKKSIVWNLNNYLDYYKIRELSENYLPTVNGQNLLLEIIKKTPHSSNLYTLRDFRQIITILDKNDPALLRQKNVYSQLQSLIEDLINDARDYDFKGVDDFTVGEDFDFNGLKNELDEIEQLASFFKELSELGFIPEDQQEELKDISEEFDSHVYDISGEVDRIEDSFDHSYEYTNPKGFDINELFSDL